MYNRTLIYRHVRNLATYGVIPKLVEAYWNSREGNRDMSKAGIYIEVILYIMNKGCKDVEIFVAVPVCEVCFKDALF